MKKIRILAIVSAIVLLASSIVFAQGSVPTPPGESLTIQKVYGIILGLACWLTQISLIVMAIAIVFYGLMFFWARGNPQAFSSAKTSFGWGIVGCLVILGVYVIIATVFAFVSDPTGQNSADPSIILQPFSNCSIIFQQIQ